MFNFLTMTDSEKHHLTIFNIKPGKKVCILFFN